MSDEERARARIEAALGQMGAELSPPVGWQARVLAEAERPRRRAWWKLAVPVLAAAAAAIVIVPRVISRPGAPEELAFDVRFDRSGPVVRGDSATIGDIATATAAGGGKHRAVWIYREERRLVIACPGAPEGCSATDAAVVAKVKLELPGAYTFVALTSSEPLPVPTDSLDESMAAAERAGAKKRTERKRVQ